MSDAALLLRARGGDELAFRRLLDAHQDVIHFHVNRYYAPGLDRADVEQEANHGFFKAVRDYKPAGRSTFRVFASFCVQRQLITAIKTATRRKHTPLNSARSFDAPIAVGAEDETTLVEITADRQALEPVETLSQRAEVRALAEAFEHLSDIERTALVGVALEDQTYETVAANAGVDHKSIDNALQRGRRKIAELVGVGADGVEAQAERPLHPQPNTDGALPRRPRQRRLGRAGNHTATHPIHPRRGGTCMSIVESIDAERTSIKEEIDALEAQLGTKREHLDGLDQLREQAVELTATKAEGGGLPETALPPAPAPAPPTGKAAGRSPEAAETEAKRIEAIVSLLAEHPDGLNATEIRRAVHLSPAQFTALRPRLLAHVRAKGNGRARVYLPKAGSAARPKPAPARDGRATPAPASKPEPRPKASEKKMPTPSSAKAEEMLAHKQRLRQAIVELVADSEPITGEEIDTMLLEQIPEAERIELINVRRDLAVERQIEKVGEDYRIPRSSSGPITKAEEEAVACLGSGRSAREVALNCEAIRDATAARAILEGLVRRKVIGRRPGSDPAVYEGLGEVAAT